MASPIIAPSILSADFGDLTQEIISLSETSAQWVHIDVMDGTFVPPITFGANVVSVCKNACTLVRDVHLMVAHPETHIDAFIDAGAQWLTFHAEATQHAHRLLGAIRSRGVKAGISINPGTPVQTIEPLLEMADLVLVMTVNPGWGGQKFIPACVEKISWLHEIRAKRNLNFLIEIDGGINPETAKICSKAGADVLVAGNYVFSAEVRSEAVKSLLNACAE